MLAWPSGRLEAFAWIPGIPSMADQERRDGLPRGTLARLVEDRVVAVAEGQRVADPGVVLDLLPCWCALGLSVRYESGHPRHLP